MSDTSASTCKQAPGVIAPVVNFNRCEGKADCAVVCPEDVFEIRRIDTEDYQRLGPLQTERLLLRRFTTADRRCLHNSPTVAIPVLCQRP